MRKICVKKVQIRSSYFPVFNSNTGKQRPEITPYFHAVRKKVKRDSKKDKYFMSCYIFILLFEKRHASGPLHQLHKKWTFPLRISLVNVTKSAVSCDLVTFTGEILNGKLLILCSDLRIYLVEITMLWTKIYQYSLNAVFIFFFGWIWGDLNVSTIYHFGEVPILRYL